jgi:hypothetical protein
MIAIWIVMERVSSIYVYAVDAIAFHASKNKGDASAIDKFRSGLKAKRAREILSITSVLGGLVIFWLMMFRPF